VSSDQISSISLKLRPRYDFSISQDGGCCCIGFSKFEIFNGRNGQEDTVPNFVEIAQIAAEILRFFDFSRLPPPPSWIFEILNF